MTLVKSFLGFCFVVMAGAVVYGMLAGDFFAEGGRLLALPWGIVALVDLYIGFALFAGWVLFRERSWVALPWIVLLLVLGNLVAALYALITLARSGGDWRRFWLGRAA